MQFSNLHTHTRYCDGAGNPEEFVVSAIEKKMSAIGFSGHAPVPFDSWWNMKPQVFEEYISEISALKQKFCNKIPIFLGAEIDFISGVQNITDFKKYNLDYIIGAIHYLKPENSEDIWDFIISPQVFAEGLQKYYFGNVEKLVRYYFLQMNTMIEHGGFDVVAHIDQIVKFNKGNVFFREDADFYRSASFETIRLCAEKDVFIELNTRGKLKNLTDNFYPSFDFLKECARQKVKIIISADAHEKEELTSYMPQAAEHLKSAGYKSFFRTGKQLFEEISL
jgi:histidinol-phosphatase (PHP family)